MTSSAGASLVTGIAEAKSLETGPWLAAGGHKDVVFGQQF
jgi:hypothetical protein